MKAQSLQCNLKGPCNAGCPFCIARTTWKTGMGDNQMMFNNLDRAFRFARYHQVDSVMITGTGEPTLLEDSVAMLVDDARRHGFPSIELQTNGSVLAAKPQLLRDLTTIGLTCVAVSIASPDPLRNREIIGVDHDYLQLMRKASEMGLLCRVTINLVKGELDPLQPQGLRDWAKVLKDHGVHQLTLRQLGVPEFNELPTDAAKRVRAWVLENRIDDQGTVDIQVELEENGHLVRKTPFGADIYDYLGLSTCVASCLTENPNQDEIRSMILQPDGHIYSSWQLPGSILI